MDNIINYSPFILIVFMFFIQYKMFMTPADFEKEKAKLIEYIAEHYVQQKIYSDNHKSLGDRIQSIDEKVDDVRNLLIKIIGTKYNTIE